MIADEVAALISMRRLIGEAAAGRVNTALIDVAVLTAATADRPQVDRDDIRDALRLDPIRRATVDDDLCTLIRAAREATPPIPWHEIGAALRLGGGDRASAKTAAIRLAHRLGVALLPPPSTPGTAADQHPAGDTE